MKEIKKNRIIDKPTFQEGDVLTALIVNSAIDELKAIDANTYKIFNLDTIDFGLHYESYVTNEGDIVVKLKMVNYPVAFTEAFIQDGFKVNFVFNATLERQSIKYPRKFYITFFGIEDIYEADISKFSTGETPKIYLDGCLVRLYFKDNKFKPINDTLYTSSAKYGTNYVGYWHPASASMHLHVSNDSRKFYFDGDDISCFNKIRTHGQRGTEIQYIPYPYIFLVGKRTFDYCVDNEEQVFGCYLEKTIEDALMNDEDILYASLNLNGYKGAVGNRTSNLQDTEFDFFVENCFTWDGKNVIYLTLLPNNYESLAVYPLTGTTEPVAKSFYQPIINRTILPLIENGTIKVDILENTINTSANFSQGNNARVFVPLDRGYIAQRFPYNKFLFYITIKFKEGLKPTGSDYNNYINRMKNEFLTSLDNAYMSKKIYFGSFVDHNNYPELQFISSPVYQALGNQINDFDTLSTDDERVDYLKERNYFYGKLYEGSFVDYRIILTLKYLGGDIRMNRILIMDEDFINE